MAGKCFLCMKPADQRCEYCYENCDESVYFCCSDHEALHRFNDPKGSKCIPISVSHKEGVGRCMVANRDIQAGELLFLEEPIIVGPNAITALQCLECAERLDCDPALCEGGCQFPMCPEHVSSPEGDKSRTRHTWEECQALSRLAPEDLSEYIYEIILPLRALLLKQGESKDAFNVLDTFMDHKAEREADGEYWERSLKVVIGPLQRVFPEMSFDDINRCVGIVEVNNYQIHDPGSAGYRGVFPLTSLISHSCSPNARLAIERRGKCSNRAVAAVDIEKGTELSINYIHLHMSNSLRRSKLKENWYFQCNCPRCEDPTEMGTNMDGVKCKECEKGYFLPKSSKLDEPSWQCDKCSNGTDFKEIQKLVQSLLDEKDGLDRGNLEAYVDFYRMCEQKLHENHYVLNACRRWIIPLYCRVTRANSDVEVDEKMLEEKISMCTKYLFTLDKVERGLTKNRGRILYEYADTYLSLQNRRYQTGRLPEEEFIKALQGSKLLSREAADCTQFDEAESFEGHVHRQASNLESEIDKFLEYLNKSREASCESR